MPFKRGPSWLGIACCLGAWLMSPPATAQIRDEVVRAFREVAGEIGKGTVANRVVRDALASWDLQRKLTEAVAKDREALAAKENVCGDTRNVDHLGQTSGNAQRYAAEAGRRRADAANDPTRTVQRMLSQRYTQSLSRYCNQLEVARGLCREIGRPFADVMSSTLFGSEDNGEGVSETYSGKQRQAAEDFADRIVAAKVIANTLPIKCQSEQCMAFEEVRKRLHLVESASRYGFNMIIGRRSSPEDLNKTLPAGSKASTGLGD